jgi:putative N-6 DNA methylase
MTTFSAKDTFIDIRNFLAGRFLGATRDEFFLDEIIKLIFCKHELRTENTTVIEDVDLASLYRKTFQTVLELHEDIYQDGTYEIELDPVSIKYIDAKLNELDLFNLERDIIGDAYEIFMGDAIKGQSGQFFTPQNAADALVKMIAPSPKSRVIDPACGAGGFLVATMKYWNKQNAKFSKDNLYGVDKDGYLTRLAKIHLACIGQVTNTIQCSDSLVWDEAVLGERDSQYDVVLTNPPFGVNIKTGTTETLSKFDLAYKYRKTKEGFATKTFNINESVAPQVVFIEQCINLAKKGGVIGIVVPESMISNKKYSYVVEYILRACYIRAIIGMPDELFKISGKGGTHTKTCLLVLEKKKKEDDKDYNIFMAEAKWCGHDSRGREIPKDDIPYILRTYFKFKNSEGFKNSNLGFLINRSQITNNVLAPRSYVFGIQNDEELRETHTMISIGQLIDEKVLEVTTGNEVGKLAYGTGNIPFIRTSDISNWEIKSEPKHLLSEEIYESLAGKQDVQEGDILMVKDGSYLIGTCAMITKYDTRMVYQSHLYKIRVAEDNIYNLDRYYLLAVLSSEYVRQQIFAKTFSQDIINSLGDRLKELIIPIAKDSNHVKHIAGMVKKTINERIAARELARKVRAEIFTI